MPFDNPNVDQMSLATLAWRLRNPETWPEGFKWDYRDCTTCAVGLAAAIHYGTVNRWEDVYDRLFDMVPDDQFRSIFCFLHHSLHLRRHAITPEHVADAIDEYLAKQS
jgi:hypothetical protein